MKANISQNINWSHSSLTLFGVPSFNLLEKMLFSKSQHATKKYNDKSFIPAKNYTVIPNLAKAMMKHN